jgi:Cys-rich repeat protein
VAKVFLSVDGEIVAGRTDSPEVHVFWVETRLHPMQVCVVADDSFGNSGRKCARVEVPVPCTADGDCGEREYCAREEIGDCDGPGVCLAYDPDSTCVLLFDPVCGCDGETYSNGCEARSRHGVNIAHRGACEDDPPPQ